ncbi:MAG: hypothetical protein WBP37_00205 [Candidatus Dechloromonas phosphoritropha]|jgi:hypothetical protein
MTECIEGDSMKAQKLLFVLAALLVSGIGDSWADRRVYGRGGVYVGPGPYWGAPYARPYYYPGRFYPRPYYPGPFLYGDPFYAPAPVVVVPPPEPAVYIERSDSAVDQAQTPAQQYWYFCRDSNRYYPYVKECPGGWQTVLPRPGQ